MQHQPLFGLIVSFILLVTACTPFNAGQPVEAQAAQHTDPPATLEISTASDTLASSDPTVVPDNPAETCPVTQPAELLFMPPPPYPPLAPYPNQFWYGTTSLWTMLPIDGIWGRLPYDDGHYSQKVFWWREGYSGRTEPEPELTMVAKRLDASAPIIETGPYATNAYHADFNWAMLAGVELPTLGCWQITGKYEGHELSFVVWVAP